MQPQHEIAVSQIVNPTLDDNQLTELVEEIERKKPLLEQRLVRRDELTSLTNHAASAYEGAADHDSIQYRKYDRHRRGSQAYEAVHSDGYVGAADAKYLLEIQQQLIELLNLHSIDVQPTELFIPPNSEYTARFYIRNILSQASTFIDIKDDYLFSANQHTMNIDMLWIIQPYLESTLGVSVRLLGGDENPPRSTVSDIKAFMRQNDNVKIKGNTRPLGSGRRETHDRFIIIDGQTVYKIGASIKDLGAAQTSIDIVNDSAVSTSYIQQFDNWWGNAHDYPNIV